MGKIDIKYFGYIYILLFMFFGAMNKIFVPFSIIASAIFTVIIVSRVTKDNGISLVKGILTLLMFQNLCIGLGAHFAGNTDESLKFITQIPFLSLVLSFVILLFNKSIKIEKNQILTFTLLVICIIVSFLIGRGTLLSVLINLRNLLTFFFAYCIGNYSILTKKDLDSLVRFIFKLAFIFLMFGIILLIFGFDLYRIIGIKEVYIAKGAPIAGERLDDRFYTTLYKREFTRMGSLLYEPVNLAYFYSMSLLLSIFYKFDKKNKYSFIRVLYNFFGLVLTFGKGGYLLTTTIILLYLFTKLFNRLKISKTIIGSVRIATVLSLLIISTFVLYYSKNIGAAATTHFWAIQLTWNNVVHKPIGFGIGTGGNMATLFNNGPLDTWLATGGESTLMSFLYQIGFQGVFCLILCMLSLRINLNKLDDINNFSIMTYFIPLALIGISLFQDNTFTPQCIVIFMFIISAGKVFYNKKNKEIEESK